MDNCYISNKVASHKCSDKVIEKRVSLLERSRAMDFDITLNIIFEGLSFSDYIVLCTRLRRYEILICDYHQ